jgi:hypothetical protein
VTTNVAVATVTTHETAAGHEVGAVATRDYRIPLAMFMAIVLAHWAEHVAQAIQVFVLGWDRPDAGGVLGLLWPWLVKSEWLHYGYAVVMLIGIWLPAFGGIAVTGRAIDATATGADGAPRPQDDARRCRLPGRSAGTAMVDRAYATARRGDDHQSMQILVTGYEQIVNPDNGPADMHRYHLVGTNLVTGAVTRMLTTTHHVVTEGNGARIFKYVGTRQIVSTADESPRWKWHETHIGRVSPNGRGRTSGDGEETCLGAAD